MIQTAESDIIGPAVTAENPLALFEEVIFPLKNVFKLRMLIYFGSQLFFQSFRPFSGTVADVFMIQPVPYRCFGISFHRGQK